MVLRFHLQTVALFHNLLQVAYQQEGGPGDDGKLSAQAEVEGSPPGCRSCVQRRPCSSEAPSQAQPRSWLQARWVHRGLQGGGFSVCLLPW